MIRFRGSMISLARIRITSRTLVCCLAALVVTGCGASKSEVRAARSSGYKTDFAIVFSETLRVVRDLYPHLTENASAGVIKTAWHPLHLSTGQSEPLSSKQSDQSLNPFSTTAPGRKQHFIRFTIYVVGGDPWRVRVEGQASEWEAGQVPVELRGGDEPHWLKGRIEALQVAIHRRLEQYAVKLESTAEIKDEQRAALPDIDMTTLSSLPPEVAHVVAATLQAAKARDYRALRATMHDEFTWSLGAPPGADTAVAMWQADSTILGHLIAAIEAGCSMDQHGTQVTCPRQYTETPEYLGYRAGFTMDAGRAWKMSFFVAGD
jgi:hypothetical protein